MENLAIKVARNLEFLQPRDPRVKRVDEKSKKSKSREGLAGELKSKQSTPRHPLPLASA
jgi:hypothetical protein